MVGPGKYDALCSYVRAQAKANGAIVIVFDGEFGHGFSAQLPMGEQAMRVAEVLRDVADQIAADALAQAGAVFVIEAPHGQKNES